MPLKKKPSTPTPRRRSGSLPTPVNAHKHADKRANIPTEEVFTAPHRDKVDGTVCSTKPLSYQGSMIDGIKVRFERGRIVEMTAATTAAEAGWKWS